MTHNRSLIHNRRLFLADLLLVFFSYLFFTFAVIRLQRGLPVADLFLDAGLLLVCLFPPRICMGVYRQVWRYARPSNYFLLICSDVVGGVLYAAVQILLISYLRQGMIPSFAQMLATVMFILLASMGMRLLHQLYHEHRAGRQPSAALLNKNPDDRINIAIVGAGNKGIQLAHMLSLMPDQRYIPYCFIDTDPQKIGGTINGLKVYPGDREACALLKALPVSEVVIAINNISEELRTALFEIYGNAGLRVRIYESPMNGVSGKMQPRIRDLNIEDLLFRYSIDFSDETTFQYYQGKTVLITGGGGSIGSELCRQVAKLSPARLIILDIYENNAYEIQQELKRHYGDSLSLSVEIASVRDRAKLDVLFEKYKPQIVFHAAAHKHVPLMEDAVDEAVKNNVFGTYNVVNAAEKAGVSKFILISTDKAVNPTNVMGATKRLCEMILQSKKNSATDFMAVRFGNVLGSNGSVIPLFMHQIEEGGPVTITDKRIIRYFMTIREAAQLVMTAGASAAKSEIYVLDMGKPVKIYDLAVNMIRMAGYEPDKDIEIKEIGLRPGEKLYEELLIKNENLTSTPNHKIFIEQDAGITPQELEEKLSLLKRALETGRRQTMIKALRRAVPTYHSPEEVNRLAEQAEEMNLCRQGGVDREGKESACPDSQKDSEDPDGDKTPSRETLMTV